MADKVSKSKQIRRKEKAIHSAVNKVLKTEPNEGDTVDIQTEKQRIEAGSS